MKAKKHLKVRGERRGKGGPETNCSREKRPVYHIHGGGVRKKQHAQ